MYKQVTQKLLMTGIMVLSLVQSVQASTGIDEGATSAKPKGSPDELKVSFAQISNILIYLVGAVAVIMMIIGGLRYVISQGDAAQVKQAKDTLLYGIIGVVVAILAFAIVKFISGSLT